MLVYPVKIILVETFSVDPVILCSYHLDCLDVIMNLRDPAIMFAVYFAGILKSVTISKQFDCIWFSWATWRAYTLE